METAPICIILAGSSLLSPNKSCKIGDASTPIPTAQGMAITIIKRMEYATFRFTCGISLAAKAVDRLGTLEADTEDAMAMGTLINTLYSPTYTPHMVL